LFGIHYPPAALAAIAMGLFMLVLYRISMILSRLKDNNIALAQKVAILEYELRHLQESRGSN
jgi:Sec-independent protein secretion pathway component TatC